MGNIINYFKKKKQEINIKQNDLKYANMFKGYTPLFSQFGTNIYASDVVQQAISCIASEMKKITPIHVINDGYKESPTRKDIKKILEYPNDLMTISDLIEKTIWLLYMNYNAFLIPTYDIIFDKKTNSKRKSYNGLWLINPSNVQFYEDSKECLYIQFLFESGYETTLKYSDVIHLRKNFSVNDFMGGNESGQPDHKPLLKTLELNNTLLEGVGKALKGSFAINGIIKYKAMFDDGQLYENIKELEEKMKNNESGILPIDFKNEYIPLNRDIKLVDDVTLKFIDEKILRNFGVPLCILIGDFTKEQQEAFYQKTLEPLLISFSQAFTKVLFSENERTRGNKVRFFAKESIFMTVKEKLEMVRLLGDSGALYENEKRAIFGMAPDPNLENVRNKSLNYISVDIANEYQMNQKNGGKENEKSNGY